MNWGYSDSLRKLNNPAVRVNIPNRVARIELFSPVFGKVLATCFEIVSVLVAYGSA